MNRILSVLCLAAGLSQLTAQDRPPPPPPAHTIAIENPREGDLIRTGIVAIGGEYEFLYGPPQITCVVYKKNAQGFYDFETGDQAEMKDGNWRMPALKLANGEYFVQAFYNDDSSTTPEVHFKMELK